VLSKQRALSTQCPSPSRHSVLSASIVCGPGPINLELKALIGLGSELGLNTT
jgi:hypothetical protein